MLTTTFTGKSELSRVSKWMLFKTCLLFQKSQHFPILSDNGILHILSGSLNPTTITLSDSNHSVRYCTIKMMYFPHVLKTLWRL